MEATHFLMIGFRKYPTLKSAPVFFSVLLPCCNFFSALLDQHACKHVASVYQAWGLWHLLPLLSALLKHALGPWNQVHHFVLVCFLLPSSNTKGPPQSPTPPPGGGGGWLDTHPP